MFNWLINNFDWLKKNFLQLIRQQIFKMPNSFYIKCSQINWGAEHCLSALSQLVPPIREFFSWEEVCCDKRTPSKIQKGMLASSELEVYSFANLCRSMNTPDQSIKTDTIHKITWQTKLHSNIIAMGHGDDGLIPAIRKIGMVVNSLHAWDQS